MKKLSPTAVKAGVKFGIGIATFLIVCVVALIGAGTIKLITLMF